MRANGTRCLIKETTGISLETSGVINRKRVTDTVDRMIKDGFFGKSGQNYKVELYLTPKQSLQRIRNGAAVVDKFVIGSTSFIVVGGAVFGGLVTVAVFVQDPADKPQKKRKPALQGK